jgi:hypothetical protein
MPRKRSVTSDLYRAAPQVASVCSLTKARSVALERRGLFGVNTARGSQRQNPGGLPTA